MKVFDEIHARGRGNGLPYILVVDCEIICLRIEAGGTRTAKTMRRYCQGGSMMLKRERDVKLMWLSVSTIRLAELQTKPTLENHRTGLGKSFVSGNLGDSRF